MAAPENERTFDDEKHVGGRTPDTGDIQERGLGAAGKNDLPLDPQMPQQQQQGGGAKGDWHDDSRGATSRSGTD